MSTDQSQIEPTDFFVAPPEETDGQLALFTQSEDGETFVSFEGETL